MNNSNELTKKQQSVFDYISAYIDENGYAPSTEEVRSNFGFKSQNSVLSHLTPLEKKGYIKRTPRIARSILIIKK